MKKVFLCLVLVLLSVFSLSFLALNVVLAQLEDEVTVDACVGTCFPTPTPTPTATPTPSATPSPTSTATATPFAILDTTDYSSNTNDLTNNGSVAPNGNTPFSTSDTSANFSGSNFLSISDATQTDLESFSEFTIEFWVNFSTLPSSGNSVVLVSKESDSNGKSYNIQLYNDSGVYKLITETYQTDTDYSQFSYIWTPQSSTWYHVAITYQLSSSGKNVSYYINGIPVGNGNLETSHGNGAGIIQDSDAPFRVGRGAYGNYFQGMIDDIRIWNDIRTKEEIFANFSKELGGNEQGLVAYWPFEFIAPFLRPGEFLIYGYAPSSSTVYMNGIAVSEETIAQQSGYFEFRRLPFPTILASLASLIYPELCFTAEDIDKRMTNPVCIPKLPQSAQSEKIGPILIPPTISIDKNEYHLNDTVKASGVSFPKSLVKVFFAKSDKKYIFELIPNVAAYGLPSIELTTDNNGYYEVTLPSNTYDDWRVYSLSDHEGSITPLSNILAFSTFPSIYKVSKVYEDITYYIDPTPFKAVVFLEFLIILFLIYTLYHINKRYKVYESIVSKSPRKSLNALQKDFKSIQEEYEKLLIAKNK